MGRIAKYILRILIIVLLNLCIIGLAGFAVAQGRHGNAVEILSRSGSRGEEVRQIQQRLQEWGYYRGEVDGIFGNETAQAVRQFQMDYSLEADGIAGPLTMEKLGLVSVEATATDTAGLGDSDYHLLARLVSSESRGEPFSGQVAVAAVILNRVEHPSFPDTITGVIYQPGAFTSLEDGQFDGAVSDSAYRAAQEALNGADPSGGAVYYYNPGRATNEWIRTRPVITEIGQHLFCA